MSCHTVCAEPKRNSCIVHKPHLCSTGFRLYKYFFSWAASVCLIVTVLYCAEGFNTCTVSGPCILRAPVQLKKCGLKLTCVLKWKDLLYWKYNNGVTDLKKEALLKQRGLQRKQVSSIWPEKRSFKKSKVVLKGRDTSIYIDNIRKVSMMAGLKIKGSLKMEGS